MNYYVYAYLRENGSPYYIGKGKGQRAYSKLHNIHVPDDKTRIVFLEKNLTNIGACALERRYIRWYGKKIDNTGILRNITDGGEGNSSKRSEEWKINHSKKVKGKKLSQNSINRIKNIDRSYMKSKEYRMAVSKSKKGKPIKGTKIITPDGNFVSIRAASRFYNISRNKCKQIFLKKVTNG